MDEGFGVQILSLMPILFLVLGLTVAILADSYISRTNRRIMLLIVVLLCSLVVQDCIDSFTRSPLIRTLASIFGYSVRPLVLLLYFYIVGTEKRIGPFWVLAAANALVHLTALFSDICFSITAENRFVRGPLGYSCHIVSAVFLVYLIWLSARAIRRDRRAEAWIPIINVLLIIASVALDSMLDFSQYPLSLLTVTMVSSSLFYYIWLHLQFVRSHEQDLMAQQRIRIMVSQIQPHFLFNTIATFCALCRFDPEKAAEVAENFGGYLRHNLDSLESEDLIPFEKELEHTRLYADIEMVRFENVHVDYRIEDGDFSLPPLTLQPIVENAIRHGVRVREDGQVHICVRRVPGGHEIRVSDNGVGFDPKSIGTADGRHIGIRNVRERVASMCGGTLSVESRGDCGTTVTILIPDRENAAGKREEKRLRLRRSRGS